MSVLELVDVRRSWLEEMLYLDGLPDQLLPMEPSARLKSSRTPVVGNPLEPVGVAVAVSVAVGVKVEVMAGVSVNVGVNVSVGISSAGDGVYVSVAV